MKVALLFVVASLICSCGTPVTVGVDSQYGRVDYSPKGGLVLRPDVDAIARAVDDSSGK